MWTQAEAVSLSKIIETVAPSFGCHVALTGGLLYKEGSRKDADFLFYRIRQVDRIDVDGLFAALAVLGIVRVSGFGWCYKATFQEKKIDCFFPEADDGEYEQEDADTFEDEVVF